MELYEKEKLIEDILEKPRENKYPKPEDKRINDAIYRRNKIFMYCFELIDNEFSLCKIIEDGSYMAELDLFIKELWKKAQIYLKTKMYITKNISSEEINISFDFFDRKIRTYLKTFYAFKESDITLENKKINFWHLKKSNIKPIELKIYYRDRKKSLEIWNNMPNKITERIEKIRLEIENLKKEKIKPKVHEGRKNNIDTTIEFLSKEILDLNKNLKRANMIKLILPIYQNYLFKDYKEEISLRVVSRV